MGIKYPLEDLVPNSDMPSLYTCVVRFMSGSLMGRVVLLLSRSGVGWTGPVMGRAW